MKHFNVQLKTEMTHGGKVESTALYVDNEFQTSFGSGHINLQKGTFDISTMEAMLKAAAEAGYEAALKEIRKVLGVKG